MKVFTLYIGTRRRGAKQAVVRMLRKRFSSFTVISGEGYFKGTPEPMWFVKIGTVRPPEVVEAAQEIREKLRQESVGIEFEGRYFRCTESDCASSLVQALKIASKRAPSR